MLRNALDFIRPPEDAQWKHVNRWRWNVCLTLLVLVAATGWLYKSVAWAGDVDKVIARKLEPVIKEQQEQRVALTQITALITENLAESTAAKIRLAISKRCKATTFAERDELTKEIDRLQILYKKYQGEAYRQPVCADL